MNLFVAFWNKRSTWNRSLIQFIFQKYIAALLWWLFHDGAIDEFSLRKFIVYRRFVQRRIEKYSPWIACTETMDHWHAVMMTDLSNRKTSEQNWMNVRLVCWIIPIMIVGSPGMHCWRLFEYQVIRSEAIVVNVWLEAFGMLYIYSDRVLKPAWSTLSKITNLRIM